MNFIKISHKHTMADAKTFCDWSVLDDLAESLTHLNIGVKGQLQSTFSQRTPRVSSFLTLFKDDTTLLGHQILIINCQDPSENNTVAFWNRAYGNRVQSPCTRFSFFLFLFFFLCLMSLKNKETLSFTLSNEAFLFHSCPCTSYSHLAWHSVPYLENVSWSKFAA